MPGKRPWCRRTGVRQSPYDHVCAAPRRRVSVRVSLVLNHQDLDQAAARPSGPGTRTHPETFMAPPAAAPAPLPQPGLLLYVSLPPGAPHAPGDLAELAEVLRDLATDLVPGADTYTALSLAPA